MESCSESLQRTDYMILGTQTWGSSLSSLRMRTLPCPLMNPLFPGLVLPGLVLLTYA